MIKAQTAVTGGGEKGGSEEGREGEGAFPGETGQAGYAEGEGGGETHRGGLFQTEVESLQGFCTRLCQTEGDRTVAGHVLM